MVKKLNATYYRPMGGVDRTPHIAVHFDGWSPDRKTAAGAVASCGAGSSGPVEVLEERPRGLCRECPSWYRPF